MLEESQHNDPLDQKAISWFSMAYSDQAWMRDCWEQDFIDSLALEEGLSKSDENPLQWLTDPSDSRRSWRERTNVGAIKAKSKIQSVKAQIMQSYRQNGELPLHMEPTPMSDVEQYLVQIFGSRANIPQELVESLDQMEEQGIKIAKKHIADHLTEIGFNDEKLEEIVDWYVEYGSVFVETPIEQEEVRYLPTSIPFLNQGNIPGLSHKPGFGKKKQLTFNVYAPWRLVLDPEANADPQAGQAAASLDWTDLNGVRALKKLEGYDKEAIDEIITIGKNEDASDNSSNSDASGYETKTEKYMGLTGADTQGYEILTIYMDLSFDELSEWDDHQDLFQELVADEFYADHDENGNPIIDEAGNPVVDDGTIFKIKTVYVGRKRVFKGAVSTIDRKRPFAYHGLKHVKGTNYFQGLFSLARPAGQMVNKTYQRGMDNALVVGSSAFGVDPDVIDADSMSFEPGAIWEVDAIAMRNKGYTSVNQAVQQFDFKPVSQELLLWANMGDALLDETTMAPKNLSGVSASSDQTATEVTTNLNSAQIIILFWLKRLDKHVMTKIINSMRDYMLVHDMLPEEARVSARISVKGAETFVTNTLNKRRITEALAMVKAFAEVNPQLVTAIKIEQLFVRALVSLGFEESEVLRDEQAVNALNQLKAENAQLIAQNEQLQAQMQEFDKELGKSKKDLTQANEQNHLLKMENRSVKADATKSAQDFKQKLDLMTENERLKREIEELKKDQSSKGEVEDA